MIRDLVMFSADKFQYCVLCFGWQVSILHAMFWLGLVLLVHTHTLLCCFTVSNKGIKLYVVMLKRLEFYL